MIFVGLPGALLVLFVVGYNRLVRLRNASQTASADVEVQLQRRHDLVRTSPPPSAAMPATSAARWTRCPRRAPRGLGQRPSSAGILADAEAYRALHAEKGCTQQQGQFGRGEQGVAIARQG